MYNIICEIECVRKNIWYRFIIIIMHFLLKKFLKKEVYNIRTTDSLSIHVDVFRDDDLVSLSHTALCAPLPSYVSYNISTTYVGFKENICFYETWIFIFILFLSSYSFHLPFLSLLIFIFCVFSFLIDTSSYPICHGIALKRNSPPSSLLVAVPCDAGWFTSYSWAGYIHFWWCFLLHSNCWLSIYLFMIIWWMVDGEGDDEV